MGTKSWIYRILFKKGRLMKPKPINTLDTTLRDGTLTSKKMSIETPIGTIESDSGNHYIDVLSIIVVIGVMYAGKKLIDKKIK